MAKTSSTSPFKVMEEEAYHAFLEWPVWLVLREKELAAYLANPSSTTISASAMSDPPTAASRGPNQETVSG